MRILLKLLLCCLLLPIFAVTYGNENMKLKINLVISQPNQPAYHRDHICTYEVGDVIKLTADFVNLDSNTLKLDNPQSSQQTLLYFIKVDDPDETIIEINPGSIDRTGEITAPVSSVINLPAQQSVSITIKLYDHINEALFEEGPFKVFIKYMGIKSNVLPFRIEYSPKSKSKLLNISLDEQESIWIRKRSIDYLKEKMNGPDIILPLNNKELPEVKSDRVHNNQRKVDIYLKTHS